MRIMRISVLLLIASLVAFTACASPATLPKSPTPTAPTQQPFVLPEKAPNPGTTVTPQAPPTPTKTDIVYVTRTGEKYHRAGCRYLSKSQIPMERKQAISEGYSPCSVCRP